jgi:hypothetical protein
MTRTAMPRGFNGEKRAARYIAPQNHREAFLKVARRYGSVYGAANPCAAGQPTITRPRLSGVFRNNSNPIGMLPRAGAGTDDAIRLQHRQDTIRLVDILRRREDQRNLRIKRSCTRSRCCFSCARCSRGCRNSDQCPERAPGRMKKPARSKRPCICLLRGSTSSAFKSSIGCPLPL